MQIQATEITKIAHRYIVPRLFKEHISQEVVTIGELSAKQIHIAKFLTSLQKLAHEFGGVVIPNYVMAQVDGSSIFVGPQIEPFAVNICYYHEVLLCFYFHAFLRKSLFFTDSMSEHLICGDILSLIKSKRRVDNWQNKFSVFGRSKI
ncbi:hypothetical protein ACP275_03G008300 [Erythranthe tilingii]